MMLTACLTAAAWLALGAHLLALARTYAARNRGDR